MVMPYGQGVTGRQKDMIHMALCTRCGRQAEPGAEFCPGCAGNPGAEAADQPMTAPAMAAAADYLRPFTAQGRGHALLPETQGPDYWTDPGIDQIPVYREAAWAAPSPSGEPPDLTAPARGAEFAGGRSYSVPDDQGRAAVPPHEDYSSGTGNVAPPGAAYLPAPGQAFTVAGERYAPTSSPRGRLQPYGPADAQYAADQQRYPIPDPPDQGPGAQAGPPYAPGPPSYPISDAPDPANQDLGAPPYVPEQRAYPASDPSYAAAQDFSGPAGPPHPANRPYRAGDGYPATNAQWGASAQEDFMGPHEDLTGLEPFGYSDPWTPRPAAGPIGPVGPVIAPVLADQAAADLAPSGPALSGPALSGPALSGPALSGPALEADRGRGAGARRLFRRRAVPDELRDDDELLSDAGPAGQPYAGAQIPFSAPARGMAAPEALQFGGGAAGTGPADVQGTLADEPVLAADSEAGHRTGITGVLTTRRPPQQGRWIAFAAAAVVLIISAGSVAILLARHSPPASHPGAGRASPSQTAPASQPTSRPLVTVLPAAASAPQARAVEAFLAAYFTAINEHDFAAYQALFGATLRVGLSPAAFARGYGSSQDSQATLHSISVSAGGRLVATVSFVSHQQPSDSATHSSCTAWTISLYLTKRADTYAIQAPPAGYGATAAACS
jgi:hypothetical protein